MSRVSYYPVGRNGMIDTGRSLMPMEHQHHNTQISWGAELRDATLARVLCYPAS